MITYEQLRNLLPPAAVEYVGNNQLKLNFSQLTGNQDLTFDSSCIEGMVKLMQGLAALTDQINQERASQSPPLSPVEFVSQKLVGTPQQPKFQFILEVAINTTTFASNLVDPT